MSETWHGTIEAVVSPDTKPRDRYSRRLLFCGAPLEPAASAATGGDDDDGSEALEVADGADEPPRTSRLPPQRVIVDARDAIPLAHAGARVSLLLERASEPGDLPVYRAARCVGYEPARDATSTVALRRALADPFALVAQRDALRAHRTAAAAATSAQPKRGARRVKGGTPLSDGQRATLAALGASHQLGTLLAKLPPAARDLWQLQRALEFAYCAADGGTLLGVDEQTLARALSVLLRGPCGARGALLEQLPIATVLALARALGVTMRTADDGAALCDALLLEQPRTPTRECAADVVARHWRALGTPLTGLKRAHVARLARAAPPGESHRYVLSAVAHADQVRRGTNFGATLVECGEVLGASDDLVSDDEYSAPLDTDHAVDAMPFTRWLLDRDYVRYAPPNAPADTATPLVWFRDAAARADEIVARRRQFARVALLDTGPSVLAHSGRVLGDELLCAGARTLLVSPSVAHEQRLGAVLEYDARRASAERVSRAALLAARDDSPLMAGAYARVALLDAHEWCEHDLAHTLARLAPLAARADTELLLAGGAFRSGAPCAHRGSGAPFADLWHAAPGRVLDPPACAAAGSPACAARAESDRCTAHCAQTLLDDVLDRAAIRAALLGAQAHWHVVGTRADLGRACGALADTLTDAESELADALRRMDAHPFLTRHTLFFAAPYVRSGAALVRVAAAFDVERQETRLQRVERRSHLRQLDAAVDGATVSLDAPGLYLQLETSDGRDHRRCCFTNERDLLCAARHRHELAAASFALARDALATHLAAPCAALVVLPAADTPELGFEWRGTDGAALRALLLRQPAHVEPHQWRTRIALPLGPAPDEAYALAAPLERRLQYAYPAPRTGLRYALAMQSGAEPGVRIADDAPDFADYSSD